MKNSEVFGSELESHGRFAQIVAFHMSELKSMRPLDILAGYSVISGGIDVIRNTDDPLKVAIGIGKIGLGVFVGSTKGR